MLIHSLSYSVEIALTDSWLNWMKEVNIPKMMQTDCFEGVRMMELLDPPPMEGTKTFSVQYQVASMEKYLLFQEKYADIFDQLLIDAFQQKCLAFQTLLKELS